MLCAFSTMVNLKPQQQNNPPLLKRVNTSLQYFHFYTVNSCSCENSSVVVILKEINNVSRALINYSVKDETFGVEI